MKEELEKIIFEFSKYVIENYDAYKSCTLRGIRNRPIAEALTKQKELVNDKILTLFNKRIEDSKDLIAQCLYSHYDQIRNRDDANLDAQDIINIIKKEVGE